MATRSLSIGRCFGHVIPQTNTEMQSANMCAFGVSLGCSAMSWVIDRVAGFGSETRFDISVRQQERLLRKSIVAYVGIASDFTGFFLSFLLLSSYS
jgi:nuclear pore complex protein Nup205